MERNSQSVFRGIFDPLVEGALWLWSLIPSGFRPGWPRLNFIAVHYTYMLSWTVFGGVILYGSSYMSYTNAIFFAAGAATQSGLNPLNINDLFTYQQITMMLISCVANPIFINTMVVFVRLYWFEKRFVNIVRESREQRKSKARTISRSRSEAKGGEDLNRLEKGVRGRRITVLHHTTQPNGMNQSEVKDEIPELKEFEEKFLLRKAIDYDSPASSSRGATAVDSNDLYLLKSNSQPLANTHRDSTDVDIALRRDIRFADEVADHGIDYDSDRTPQQDTSKHIEFLEKQQKEANDGTALRIPGPREFDRGEVPQQLEKKGRKGSDMDMEPLAIKTTNPETDLATQKSSEGSPVWERGAIKFNDFEHPGHHDRASGPARHHNRIRHHPSDSNTTHSVADTSRLPPSRSSLSEGRNILGRTLSNFTTFRTREKNEPLHPYLSYDAAVGRNSAFLSLTVEQREELGGIEYRALKTLAKILILYYVGYHVFGMVIYTPWIIYTKKYREIVVADGIDPGWWGVFTAASAFTDLGFTLTPNSMNSFAESTLALLVGSFLIIIGNTGFPVMLRLMIWIASKLVPYGSAVWEELRFLLDHPRRCFTLLFPSRATWWLFWILVLLNGIDLIFYIILDLHAPAVTNKPGGYRVLDGWFQATSTRTAGFSCINLANLHPAIQVSYMIMMYISVFPIAISVRRTNVYEEKSLGIWGGEDVPEDNDASYVPHHMRRQLSFDLWYIFLGFFIICIAEGKQLQDPNLPGFTMFNVLFEIVSAYGTVGLSLGYPNTDTSFSAQFKVISKLVIIAMMIRGRHRGLPYALDRAILLPRDYLSQSDQEDNEKPTDRRASAVSQADGAMRRGSWKSRGLDENGLPRLHLGDIAMESSERGNHAATIAPPAPEPPSSTISGRVSRRNSGVSSVGGERKSKQRRNLRRMLASGLSAGPTYSKYD